jgi:hypothetical protein
MKLTPVHVRAGKVVISIDFAEGGEESLPAVPFAMHVDLQKIPPHVRAERLEKLVALASFVAQEVDRLFA